MKIRTTLISLGLALAFVVPAQAQGMHYLVKQWLDNGQRFCRYSNGTVLNMGMEFCPFNI